MNRIEEKKKSYPSTRCLSVAHNLIQLKIKGEIQDLFYYYYFGLGC